MKTIIGNINTSPKKFYLLSALYLVIAGSSIIYTIMTQARIIW